MTALSHTTKNSHGNAGGQGQSHPATAAPPVETVSEWAKRILASMPVDIRADAVGD